MASREDKYKTIDGVSHKRCSTCKEYVPADQFSIRRASPDGLGYSCKTCERKAATTSYKKKEQKKKSQQRYQDNKEAYNERAKERYAANKEEIQAKQAIWRGTNKGKQILNEASARRRQRIMDQTPNGRDYVVEEIVLRDSVDGICLCQICGDPIDMDLGDMQIDHIITIAAGGSDTRDNVRCTHKTCNLTRPKNGADAI